MTTLAEINSGACSLVHLVRIIDYMEMRADIDWANRPKPKGGRNR